MFQDFFKFVAAPIIVGIALKLFDRWHESHGNDM
ncbi:MAG: type I toxin-antitoxin system Fst family toxin [Lactobacillus sp.]|jgi:hypothetical protein|nr:type I toxin-antitoxin system Fst family toxin [Lactobacillus sp.]MCH3906187.1 type I toxin-antitoxin system Fst family toxin [Lactobacillus sp.]MCH3990236.1 type I toxin-antitoxin system Fst family toxin [Lactobacillus sp.]MCH4069050.1 type I toxin-antitoxin system Fst family toxin [Lactobacillus sp.]MCI1303452.1 type I toxin-antitoxin system Fst family toxin [Lactobacillus sp.]